MIVGDAIAHRTFADLGEYLTAGDVLVLNETRVIAARVFGRRARSGGRVELLLLHPAGSLRYRNDATRWIALARPARRLHAGDAIEFGEHASATVVSEADGGIRELEFSVVGSFESFLASAGRLPLPPYVHNDSEDAQLRYQTVFARVPGSVAAPTASLHFTSELLAALERSGIEIVRINLDVGLGTFRPIATERIDMHAMHREAYAIPEQSRATIQKARAEGRRVVAAGTTVVRALEGNVRSHGRIVSGDGETELFITPGFEFRVVDAVITNFHLPRSSLLVLVSAFAGRSRILEAYAEAVRLGYRFFSFGDAMFLTR
jgi:S-adenosylmethionine:tRNA ribosyltransferase-isomerase